MQIPSIRQSGGVFEIFVPGIFFLFNVVFAIYLILDQFDSDISVDLLLSNFGVSLIGIICLGYLFGMLLRLFRSEQPDRYSSLYFSWIKNGKVRLMYIGKKGIEDILTKLEIEDTVMKQLLAKISNKELDSFRKFKKLLQAEKGLASETQQKIIEEVKRQASLWSFEKFPYIEWIGIVVKYNLPTPVLKFYTDFWSKQLRELGNKRFFNFCKRLIFQKDDPAIDAIISSETTLRYLSGMTHAIKYSTFLIIIPILIRHLGCQNTEFTLLGLLILVIYLLAFFSIVKNYKYLRIREVELVFDVCYKYRADLKKHFEEVSE